MARERKRGDDPEASLFDRREYLRATGLLAGSVGLGAAGLDAADRVEASTSEITAEVSSVTTDHGWTTVELSNSYTDPVVLAPTPSHDGRQSASPRLRNVTGTSFELAVEEWLYLDGRHRTETLGYLATDPGSYALADGTTVEVGRTQTDHGWQSVSFSASFPTTPVVFSQAQSVNGGQPVVTRNRDRSTGGMGVRLQEEEAKGAHRTETIGYLAVEPGTGTLNGRAFEAGTESGVGGSWQTIRFDGTYQQPVLLADLQTSNGRNTCGVRYRNLTDSSVEVLVEEERSADSETRHLGERVGYLVVEGADASSGDTPLSELDRNRVERRIHEYVNDRRAEHGLAALSFDTDLREIARYHSRDMAKNDYFAHTSPSGETMADRYDKFGYECRAETGDGTYLTGSENIAYTYYDTPVQTDGGTVRYTNADELAQGIVRQWMNSAGHRENILREAWDDEGIGVYVTGDGKVYATQNFC